MKTSIGVKYPPGPEPPSEGPESVQIIAVWCYDHKTLVGPGPAGSVSEDLWIEHRDCETETIDEWREEIESE